MKKITIVTIYDPIPNYGNRLQNYATQLFFENQGFKVETVSFEKELFTKKIIIKYILQKLSGYKLPGDKTYWKFDVERILTFAKFNKKYIKTRHVSSIDEIDSSSDFFVAGSDQIWNPSWYASQPLKKDMYLLTFAPSEKKVCMAPSFGVDYLPKEWQGFFKEQLQTFPNLSVREQAGADLIYKLTGRKAEVVIDPTLLLEKSEWLKFIRQPKKIDCSQGYILTYFLGGRNIKQNVYISEIADKYDLKIYNLLDRDNQDLYAVSPTEFLYLIKNAKLIFTDSFHACVFSFLFDRPFLVYKRNGAENNMFSRIDGLLNTFLLTRKCAEDGINTDLFECNYSEGKEILVDKRIKAIEFLDKSMAKCQE